MQRVAPAAAFVAAAAAFAQEVSIGVFGLFHPAALSVRPAGATPVVIALAGTAVTLEGGERAQVRFAGDHLAATIRGRKIECARLTAAARDGGAADVVLAVPGQIERRFRGKLEIKPARWLQAIVRMDIETATASVVAAESEPRAHIEALKAQAVAARSYFVAAGRRHDGFDFCDTTHCQFLRQPPGPGSLAARAAEATRGLVLFYRGEPLAALYSASCGGRTRALPERARRDGGYAYFSVECRYCRGRRAAQGRAPRGWTYGIGLCQRGAAGMAAAGASFEQILRRYYPNTTLGRPD